jgi:hypothetical protein
MRRLDEAGDGRPISCLLPTARAGAREFAPSYQWSILPSIIPSP